MQTRRDGVDFVSIRVERPLLKGIDSQDTTLNAPISRNATVVHLPGVATAAMKSEIKNIQVRSSGYNNPGRETPEVQRHCEKQDI